MKKKLVLFLTLTMTVGMLTACGNSGSISASGSSSADAGSSDTDAGGSDAAGDDSEASGGEAAEPVTIEFWNSWTGSDGDTLVAKVNEFNETNQWGIDRKSTRLNSSH